MMVDGEGVSIILVQSIHRPKPHKPLVILQDTLHYMVGQTMFAGEVSESGCGCLRMDEDRGIWATEKYEDKEDKPHILAISRTKSSFVRDVRLGQL